MACRVGITTNPSRAKVSLEETVSKTEVLENH